MLRYFHRKLIQPIFTINDTPHSIALGTALGIFIALTPTVGVQMALAVILGTLIRANRIIAVVLCWISNPVTFLPMYYGYYWLGGKVLGIDTWTFGNFSERFQDLMLTRERLGYIASIKQLGFETALPLWVGSLIVATVAALPAYPLVLVLLQRKRRRQAEKAAGAAALGERPPAEAEGAEARPGSRTSPGEARREAVGEREERRVS